MKFPSRNVLAGGLVSVIVWLAMMLLAHYGITVDAETQTALILVVAFVLVHAIPRGAQDIIAELNDAIVGMAQADPNSDVSYVLPPAHVPPGEPAMIGGPATVGGMAQLALPPPKADPAPAVSAVALAA